MKNTILLSAVGVTVISVLAFASGFWLKDSMTKETKWVHEAETIDMTGEAVIDTPIQFVRIKAKVTANDLTNPATAKISSDETVHTLIAACIRHDIQRSAIDGSQVYVGPNLEYSSDERKEKQIGYEALRSLNIRLNDLPKLDSLLTDMVRDNKVSIQGLEFGSDEAESAYNRALKEAVAVARRRADQLAAAAGFKITSIVDVDDTGWADFLRSLKACSASRSDEKINEASSFTKNTMTITAKVHVQFAVEPIDKHPK